MLLQLNDIPRPKLFLCSYVLFFFVTCDMFSLCYFVYTLSFFSSHSYSSLLLSYIVHHVLVKLTIILTIIGVIRMDLNLRKAILSNIAENDQEQLEATIVDAVQQGEEKMLPGRSEERRVG